MTARCCSHRAWIERKASAPQKDRVPPRIREECVMNMSCTTSPMPQLLALMLVLVSYVAPTVWAQNKIDKNLMQRYGGVLAPDCSNYMLPQLKYLGDTLVVQDGSKAVLTGRNVKAAPTFFGAKAPPEFET